MTIDDADHKWLKGEVEDRMLIRKDVQQLTTVLHQTAAVHIPACTLALDCHLVHAMQTTLSMPMARDARQSITALVPMEAAVIIVHS